ncbi:hypothetical protein K443DRAFT_3888 [Laccaria amethystina LaAM-08-1]|uniref:CxC1-like cysteine cluster associated with KDZ transposases domain-containing protein n=1 Tax=Laccaria amethystina LaAM-08-1 TaxID=1095629 RepID=A0A0C9Y5I0_9AGAR|nr:hypothetical protein K443DRAFT_3888 [Laccaria amethystina LaAM-08-1]
MPCESLGKSLQTCLSQDKSGFPDASVPSGPSDVALRQGNTSISAAFVREGLIPCAPYLPTVGVTTRLLELYHNASLRCPHLSIHSFIKALCDLHGTPFRPYLRKQFSNCFDVYLSIRHHVNQRVEITLKRDDPGWRLRHACPCCTHKHVSEPELVFDMLVTMDGNDSLKRVQRRKTAPVDPGDGTPVMGESSERKDERTVGAGYYIERETVDIWEREIVLQWIKEHGDKAPPEGDETTPCEDRWTNMANEGASLGSRWHVVPLDVEPKNSDTECWSAASTDMPTTASVNFFSLPLILRAWALRISKAASDSSPNQMPLPPLFATQVSSINLSEFLVNNYKQALGILKGEAAFVKQMQDQGIADTSVFKNWLAEEKAYLEHLSREPLEESLAMEYWQKLVNLGASERRLAAAVNAWEVLTPITIGNTRDLTQSQETERRHAQEVEAKDLLVVQSLEVKMGILRRWGPNDEEWKQAVAMVGRRRYQRCLDSLEGLIVARMFELTKMNMSQTGYKLRKHIGNALKARSQAVCTALQNYNVAAQALVPLRPPLSWDDVVEYAFLADFDLLSDTRSDVRLKIWAKPASRILMDQHFKVKRAREEILRLNVEIPRLATYIRDEEAFLLQQEELLSKTDPPLSRQLRLRRLKLIRSNDLHIHRFNKLASLPGFSGSINPGTSVNAKPVHRTDTNTRDGDAVQEPFTGEEEEEEEEQADEVADALCLIVEGPGCSIVSH